MSWRISLKLYRPCISAGPSIRWSSSLSHFTPDFTSYYLLDPQNEDILGKPRVESTRIQAAARRIADKFLLYDSVQQAMLENEEAEDFGSVEERPLKDFVDEGEQSQPHGQLRNANGGEPPINAKLYWLLAKPPDSISKQNKLLREIAKFLTTRSINRLSTYHVIMRRLILAGQIGPCQDVLDTLLMTRIPLGWSTMALAIELAILRNDRAMFRTFADIALSAPNGRFTRGGTEEQQAEAFLKLGEACLKYSDSSRLRQLLEILKLEQSKSVFGFIAGRQLLLVMAEASARWRDTSFAEWAWSEYANLRQPGWLVTSHWVRFLVICSYVPRIRDEARSEVKKLEKSRRQQFWRIKKLAEHRYPNPLIYEQIKIE